MITACYDLRLTCDVADCPHGAYGERCNLELQHEYGASARAAARRRGWWLDQKNGTCACPKCAAAGHRPTEPDWGRTRAQDAQT